MKMKTESAIAAVLILAVAIITYKHLWGLVFAGFIALVLFKTPRTEQQSAAPQPQPISHKEVNHEERYSNSEQESL